MTTTVSGTWLSVDGVEAAGKTTISELLSQELGASIAPEFSDADFGRALQTAVRRRPHYISSSVVGQSLVFLGDFFEVYQTRVFPIVAAGGIVVSDRGYLSKYAYQAVVLKNGLDPIDAERFMDGVLSFMAVPDVTIYLHAPIDVIKSRIEEREGACSQERLAFIEAADNQCWSRLGRYPLLNYLEADTDRAPDDVMDSVLPHLT